MEISVSAEALVFLKTVLGGALCGMIFDIYRILKSVKKSTFVIEAGDIIVWIAAARMSFFGSPIVRATSFAVPMGIYPTSGRSGSCISPAIVLMVVLLPAPFAPIIATSSPSFTSSEMPWMTATAS